MPVQSEVVINENSNRLTKSFIRIQNLPWTACASDIKLFFRGLAIKEGGIIVRNFEAYVAFENPSDVRLALYRRNIVLHGCKLELSVVDEVELQKSLRNIVRRKLDFESTGKTDIAMSHFEATPRRKIRPTPVTNDKHRSVSSSAFLPEEVEDFSLSRSEGDFRFNELFSSGKRSVSGMRRLKPTSISHITENLATFHSEACNQAKRIKLEER